MIVGGEINEGGDRHGGLVTSRGLYASVKNQDDNFNKLWSAPNEKSNNIQTLFNQFL